MAEPLSASGAAAWIFTAGLVGACVGSFLNVVVYRLPRGLSIVYPGSHCPRCGRPIRWYDNIPVASWLALRGRCRDCRGAISARYPLVEAAVAAVFIGVLQVEPLWSLAPIAARPPAACADLARAALGGYHLLMLCTLLALSLMEFEVAACAAPRRAAKDSTARSSRDSGRSRSRETSRGTASGPNSHKYGYQNPSRRSGQRLPWSPAAGATLCGLLLPIAAVLAARGMARAGAWPGPAGGVAAAWLARAGAGMVAGAVAGFLTWPATGLGPNRQRGHGPALAGLVLAGSFVGAGAVLTIAGGAAAAYFLAVLCLRLGGGRSGVPWTMTLFLAALAWLLLGASLAGWGGIPGPDGLRGNLLPVAGCLALLAGLSWLTWALAARRS